MSPRRLRLYGVGMGKSGTHSLAAVFERDYRAAHEPDAKELMELLFDVWAGVRPWSAVAQLLQDRDARLDLEVDASLVNGEVVSDLVALWPEARFVLTVRDPRSWLDSMANHSLAHETPDHWTRWRDIRFRADELTHPPEEEALAARGLYTLDGYLGSWARHNRMVLEAVPEERLFVVRTEDLGARLDELAAFAGVPRETLDEDRAHEFPAAGRFDVLGELDPGYLQARIDHHCGDLLSRLGH
jgi:Sulfotransferase domain